MCIATDGTNLIKSVTTMDDVECGCKYKTAEYKEYFYINDIFQCYATNTFSAPIGRVPIQAIGHILTPRIQYNTAATMRIILHNTKQNKTTTITTTTMRTTVYSTATLMISIPCLKSSLACF